MAEFVKLNPSELKALREVNPLLMSYNVEFAEVTGGTFWKAYTPGQIAGTEPFYVEPSKDGIAAMYKDLMQVYPPIDLYNPKLRKLTKDLGTAWVRVSGTWATKTYYDFDGEYADGTVPEGYLNVLTKKQWIGVLDFVRDCGLKLKVSVANCPGLHSADEPWPSTEAEKLFKFSKEYGVPIQAAEFTNEPNMMEDTGFPKGYHAEHYRRDADLFASWLKENYPECLYVGPSTTGGDNVSFGKMGKEGGGVEQLSRETCGCDDLLGGTKVPVDVFSYHYYNGISDRLASVMPAGHWDASEANSEEYLDTAMSFCRTYLPFRDKYCPGGEIWVTESGDAGGGGDLDAVGEGEEAVGGHDGALDALLAVVLVLEFDDGLFDGADAVLLAGSDAEGAAVLDDDDAVGADGDVDVPGGEEVVELLGGCLDGGDDVSECLGVGLGGLEVGDGADVGEERVGDDDAAVGEDLEGLVSGDVIADVLGEE